MIDGGKGTFRGPAPWSRSLWRATTTIRRHVLDCRCRPVRRPRRRLRARPRAHVVAGVDHTTPTPPPPPAPVFGPVEVVAPTPRRVLSHGHSQSEPFPRPKIYLSRRYSSLDDLHADDELMLIPRPAPVAPVLPIPSVPSIPSAPDKQTLALAELVDTEAAYLAHLNSLALNYIAHLPPLPSADLTAIVRNTGALVDLHTRIAADLAVGPTSRSYVCSVLESWAPYMATLYAEFCAGHDAAAAVLRRAQERDPQQWALWERQRALYTHRRRHSLDEAPPASLALSFSDLLIMPVQRVCKYHLLVSALRGPPGRDPDERAIMNCINAMHSVAAQVDEAQRVREAEHRARLVLERMDPVSGLDLAHLARLGPCLLIGSLDVCYYTSSRPAPVSLNSYASHNSLATPGPSPHPLPSTVPFPQSQSQTPTTPHPLSNSQKPLKVRHLAAFLWPGYLVLCKVNAKRGRYEPKHWFILKQATGPAQSIEGDHTDPDASVSMEDTSFDAARQQQWLQPPPMTHVDVSPASTVFTHGVRIAFAKHVFELGASCAEERDVWLAAVAGAREVEKEGSIRSVGGAIVSRSRSAVVTSPENDGLELVRSRSEGGRGRSRSRSRPPEKSAALGIAERVENAFLRDRQSESSAGASPVSVNTSLNAAGASVTRNVSGGSSVGGRLPVRVSVVSGPGGTVRGATGAEPRPVGMVDGRPLGANGQAYGTVNGHGHSLSVNSGANVARTNSSSTSGTRSYPPSPVMATHSLQIQPAPSQSVIQSQAQPPSQPQPQPSSQPQSHPQLTLQTQLLPVSLVVHRPSTNVRDMVDRAIADIVSWPCTEARMKGGRRGPLFAAPEDTGVVAAPKSAGAGLGGGGVGTVMGIVRPRRTSSALVGRHKSLLEAALPGKEKEKDKDKKKVRPASEGVVVEAKKEATAVSNAQGEGAKTPLQRKRATIHGTTDFPTMDPPNNAPEQHAVQVVAPSGQVLHPTTNGKSSAPGDPAVSGSSQIASDMRRNASTGSQKTIQSGKPISPPRSRTVSSSGSLADGMRELFNFRRTFIKSAENIAAPSPPQGPNPVYSVGAGLTNTRSDEVLVPRVKPKPKTGSTPAVVQDVENKPELYSLGAGITNTTTPPKRQKKPVLGACTEFARGIDQTTDSSARIHTTLSAHVYAFERKGFGQRSRGLPDGSLAFERVVPSRSRASYIQQGPVAEEGIFVDFNDEVYSEERY
ncbi:PHD finger protein rhinoceros [Ceratobasidium sp. AG-Ba]|nr:PHD finger protein rhinoceros [Ceratobasidium sp. AG-Ba]